MWRLGAWAILELPVLAASSKMEKVHWWLAKPDNPAMSPHDPGKTGTYDTDKRWKVEGKVESRGEGLKNS